MPKFKIQKSPFTVPTTDGKLIEEIWGNSTGNTNISIARMVAPPNWSEPHQTPEFDEFTYIIKGKKQFEIDGETLVLEAGQSILIEKGARERMPKFMEWYGAMGLMITLVWLYIEFLRLLLKLSSKD